MIIEIIGWTGSILVVIAYAITVVTKNKYLSLCNYLNLFGAILVGINCLENHAFPSLMLNVMWSGIAIFGIIVNLTNKLLKN
jgi:hypothetical protein